MDSDEKKAIGQFKLQLNGVLSLYNLYGMSVYIPSTISEIVKLSIQLHRRLNGEDIPIEL